MKLFKRSIEIKTKKLDADERILYLANKLIKEIKDSGRGTSFEQLGRVIIPVTLHINVHTHYTPSRLFVECSHHNWQITGDYKE